MIDKITSLYPEDNFISEEGYSLNEIKNKTWIIEPIDGMHHYMNNSIFLEIQVSFVDNSEIQFSIIYLPNLNEIYYAMKDFEQCNVEFCGSIYKFFDDKANILKEIILSENKVANVMHINSCCVAFSNLVSGRPDALILSAKKCGILCLEYFYLRKWCKPNKYRKPYFKNK